MKLISDLRAAVGKEPCKLCERSMWWKANSLRCVRDCINLDWVKRRDISLRYQRAHTHGGWYLSLRLGPARQMMRRLVLR